MEHIPTPPQHYGRWLAARLVLLWVISLATTPGMAAPETSPSATVASTLDQTREAVLDNADRLGSDRDVASRLIRQRLVPRIDTRATARFVLANDWARAQVSQRDAFHNAFTRHVTETYALLLNRFADEVIRALKGLQMRTTTVRENDKTALVRAFFRIRDGKEYQVRIHLHARDGQWLLFDAEYAGFSLLQIWRAEIQGRLSQESLGQLTSSLRERHSDETAMVPQRE